MTFGYDPLPEELISKVESILLNAEEAFYNKLVIEEVKLEEKRKRATKIEAKDDSYRAAAAAYFGKSRQQAESIKSRLWLEIVDNLCPYCIRNLGNNPEADHIHPISKGGLSTVENMVYICRDCNSNKTNLTLREFINKYKLNRLKIEETLEKMGKAF